jgi:hypothetical protein
VKDKHYASVDELIAEIAGMRIEDLANEPWEGPHLISVDELRAAGALDVPEAWRKTLGVERELPLFAGLSDDDDALAETPPSTPLDPDSDESADEVP